MIYNLLIKTIFVYGYQGKYESNSIQSIANEC